MQTEANITSTPAAGASRRKQRKLEGIAEEERQIPEIDVAAAILVEAEEAKAIATKAYKEAEEDLQRILKEKLAEGQDRYAYGEWEAWLDVGKTTAKAKRIAEPQDG